MNEYIVRAKTLPEAYHQALDCLWQLGDVTMAPDWNTKRLECSMTLEVSSPLKEPMISKFSICGPRELEQYRQEMLDGILDFEIEKGNWSYTYHQRYANQKYLIESEENGVEMHRIDQYKFIIEELKRNPFSTRAVMDLRALSDVNSDDPACCQHIQFFVRNGALDCKVLFRSNDAVKATFMNAFALIMLQKKVADELGYDVGTYVHRANSFHAYKKDWDNLEKFVDRYEASDDESQFAYSYTDEWKELMRDEQPAIAKMVEELRNN